MTKLSVLSLEFVSPKGQKREKRAQTLNLKNCSCLKDLNCYLPGLHTVSLAPNLPELTSLVLGRKGGEGITEVKNLEAVLGHASNGLLETYHLQLNKNPGPLTLAFHNMNRRGMRDSRRRRRDSIGAQSR